MFESRMVASARVNPASIALIGVRPRAHFLADALVDQHVGIDGDADREHDAGNAGQRQRRIEHRQDAEDHGDVDCHRDIRKQAEQPISDKHEDNHHGRADIR